MMGRYRIGPILIQRGMISIKYLLATHTIGLLVPYIVSGIS